MKAAFSTLVPKTPSCVANTTRQPALPGASSEEDAANLVPEELGAGAEHVWEQALQQALKALPVGGRDAVPRLGSPTVQIVHAGEIHVLRVPAPGVALVCMLPSVIRPTPLCGRCCTSLRYRPAPHGGFKGGMLVLQR